MRGGILRFLGTTTELSTMGKQSKAQRTANRKLRAELEASKLHMASVNAWKDRQVEDTKARAELAEAKLQRWHDDIARFCAASTLLPLKEKLRFLNHHMRVVVTDADMDDMRYVNAELANAYRSIPTEQLMMILQDCRELRDDLCRRIHFRVTNAPNSIPDFTYAYAVSHHALSATRVSREHFVEMVARDMARGIWCQLFGDKK